MGRLVGITVIKEKADLYDDWRKMYEEDLERLERLEREEEKCLEDKIKEAIEKAMKEVRKE